MKLLHIIVTLFLSISFSFNAQSADIRLDRSKVNKPKEYTLNALKIEQVLLDETAVGENVGVGYLSITNTGEESDELVLFTSDFSKEVELHDEKKIKSLKIPAGETVHLKKDEIHFKFVGLKKAIAVDGFHTAILTFKKAGQLKVDFTVQEVAKLQTIPSLDIF